jgi:uncharacterized 2Fe-2S/4Fe-4S cluster protein (DUF4445 family)
MALLSQEIRQEAIKLSEKVRYLELTVEKGFSREFMEALYIPHKDTSRFHSVKQI